MTSLFLTCTLLVTLSATAGLVKARRLRFMVVPWFAFAWFGSEMPIWLLAFQVLLIAAHQLFADTALLSNQLAIALALWNCVALIHLHKRNVESGKNAAQDYQQKTGRNPEIFFNEPGWQKPFTFHIPGVKTRKDIEYGPHARHKLDVYYSAKPVREKRPVLLQVHGGAWVIGNKQHQALPLMNFMASKNWICVACNYRLGPDNRFPAMIEDIEMALEWIRQNISQYGGDPDFICCTGGSAGGHLSSLLAIRQQEIKACVTYYGIYDFLDSAQIRREMSMEAFLEKSVMPGSVEACRADWENASPMLHASQSKTPFLVIHGSHDSLAFCEEAELFASKLGNQADSVYLPVFGAQHAFDLIWSERNQMVVQIVYDFLESRYQLYQQAKL